MFVKPGVSRALNTAHSLSWSQSDHQLAARQTMNASEAANISAANPAEGGPSEGACAPELPAKPSPMIPTYFSIQTSRSTSKRSPQIVTTRATG